MRTLYLHIGTHRTATSSIQAFLHANFSAPGQRGVLYPLGVKRHVGLMNAIFSGQRTVDDVARDLDRRAGARRSPVQSLILSDEDICTRRDLSVLAGLRAFFNVKVVFCLRRQDLWLESWYLQNVKWQWNPNLSHISFDAFLDCRDEFHWADYRRYVDHLEQVFGQGNVLLSVFERGQMPAGPVAAFCELVGIGVLDGLTAPPHSNSSHSPLVSEFMRRLPLDEAPPAVRGMLERACAAVDEALEKTPEEASPLLMPHDRRRAILDEHAEGNAALARRYFGRDRLFLDPLPPADATVARLALPADSEALMTRLVAPFVRAVTDQIREKL
jgi:hypothetical protein